MTNTMQENVTTALMVFANKVAEELYPLCDDAFVLAKSKHFCFSKLTMLINGNMHLVIQKSYYLVNQRWLEI